MNEPQQVKKIFADTETVSLRRVAGALLSLISAFVWNEHILNRDITYGTPVNKL